jgi:hypothetical protein
MCLPLCETVAKPNVVAFFTDQQRWDSTGLHGNPHRVDALTDAPIRYPDANKEHPDLRVPVGEEETLH